VGDADITGSLRANTLYAYTLLGGSIGNNQTLVIGSNINATANVSIASNLTVGANAQANNILTNTLTANTKITVGNTVLNTANLYADFHFGTWTGNVIKPQYGGTGSNVVPPNGSLLIGNGNNYVNALLTTSVGIQLTVGPGSIRIDNTGVTAFRTATSTANVYTDYRSGPVTLTGGDVLNALGYVPGNANSVSWYTVGTDLNYYTGNVAVGYTDNQPRSNAKLQILATDTTSNLPGLLVENRGNNATSGAYVNLSVANTSSLSGIRFQSALTNSGTIEYSASRGFMSFTTGNVLRGGFDNSGNIGLGTTTPQPNKGGTGLHIVANNAGMTLDSGSGNQWHMGMNPNIASINSGARIAGQFGIFSDNANTGIVMAGTSANTNTGTSITFVTNGLPIVGIDNNGRMRINSGTQTAGTMLQVGGDVATEGNFVTLSDYRLKDDVEELTEQTSLYRIQQLRPVTFKWKSNSHLEEGFIAHEVKEVVPTAVKGVKDAFDYQTLDKSQLTPVIVKSIQALINIVNEQQEEINALKEVRL
ncbi:MAG: tail fiber domain-containing protein, partial [Hymenobacter sp.]